MSPSRAWAQLHSRRAAQTEEPPSGCMLGSRSGRGGGSVRCPMYAQTMPPRSRQG